MDAVEQLLEKARQCRRLALAANDDRATAALVAMAKEFEAAASLAEPSQGLDRQQRAGE